MLHPASSSKVVATRWTISSNCVFVNMFQSRGIISHPYLKHFDVWIWSQLVWVIASSFFNSKTKATKTVICAFIYLLYLELNYSIKFRRHTFHLLHLVSPCGLFSASGIFHVGPYTRVSTFSASLGILTWNEFWYTPLRWAGRKLSIGWAHPNWSTMTLVLLLFMFEISSRAINISYHRKGRQEDTIVNCSPMSTTWPIPHP